MQCIQMRPNAVRCSLTMHEVGGGQYWRLTSFPNIRRWRWHYPIASSPRRLHTPDSPQRNEHQPKRAVFPPAAARETCEGVANLEQGSSSTAQQLARMSESGPPAARAGSHLSSTENASTVFKTPHDQNSRAASQCLRSRWTAWLRHRYHR